MALMIGGRQATCSRGLFSTLSTVKTPPRPCGFTQIASCVGRTTMALTKAPSEPLHDAPPVVVAWPGVCGFCGLGTKYACPQCRTVHFCSRDCLERGRAHDCDGPTCQAVALPSNCAQDRSTGGLVKCWINAYLRGGGGFSLRQPERSLTLQPSLSYGLASLQLSPRVAADLAKECTSGRDREGFLKIGANSYPGYAGYTAIPGVVNAKEQSRATAQLARNKRGGRGGLSYDRDQGLQYALDNCEALRLLVGEVCKHLGGRPPQP